VKRTVQGLVLLAIFAAACSKDASSAPTPAPATSPETVLKRAEAAIQRASGYTIEVAGHNFVLPRWGGIDEGTVEIGASGPVALARLQRTGDGAYRMILVAAQTYFRRSTCSHDTRVPGGGADVFAPFLLASNGYLSNASGLTLTRSDDGRLVRIAGAFGDLGPGAIEIDTATYLPTTLSTTANAAGGSQTAWRFTKWGEAPAVTAPAGDVPDNGPGGNPC